MMKIQQKNIPKPSQNSSKMLPKPTQNPQKILSKLGLSWDLLAPSWAVLAPRGPEEGKKTEKWSSDPPLGLPFLEGFGAMLALCWAKLRSKSALEPHLVNLYIKACI